MTVIRYTNPKFCANGRDWACCVCNNKYDTDTEARQCAERDHERKNK
jgi:hypothetical protein